MGIVFFDGEPPWSGGPGWVPVSARVYLAHTETGFSFRRLARILGCHASTVLRQVRRIESLRDDPLADAALSRLGRHWKQCAASPDGLPQAKELPPMALPAQIDDETLSRESLRALRALLEPRTLLVVADGVEEAVVVHNAGDGRPVRRAVISREVAETLALRELISGETKGRLARYAITTAGRNEARRLLAEAESRRAAVRGTAEDADAVPDPVIASGPGARKLRESRRRSPGADAPIHVLARRRRADGTPFLPADLVAAALRFRESYELARMGGSITRDWEQLVAGRVRAGSAGSSSNATRRLEAEESLAGAIRALGPDLAECVILAVCHEEGMEEIESRLEFPARSGKIVLRIALRTLQRHYSQTGSDGYDLIY